MHFSLRPATQADGRKITIRQALVNLTDWQTAMPEDRIFRAMPISKDDYQRRAKAHLEKGESGQNWPLIILATVLAILGVGLWRQGQQHACSGRGSQWNWWLQLWRKEDSFAAGK
jgi:uncharacterized protein (DUF2384 family)